MPEGEEGGLASGDLGVQEAVLQEDGVARTALARSERRGWPGGSIRRCRCLLAGEG